MRLGDRKDNPAVTQKQTWNRVEGLSGRWKCLVKKGIVEKQLEKHRDVLHDFDIDRRQFGYQPVAGQPGHTDKSAQYNCEDNPDKRDV